MSVRDRGRCPFPVRHLIRSLPTKWERVFNGSLLQRTKSPDYKLWSLKSLSHRIRGYRRLRPGELDRRYWLQRGTSTSHPKGQGPPSEANRCFFSPSPPSGADVGHVNAGATLRVEPGQCQTQRAKLLPTPASSFVPNRSTRGNLALRGLVVGQGSQREQPGTPYASGKRQAEEGQQEQEAPIPLRAALTGTRPQGTGWDPPPGLAP